LNYLLISGKAGVGKSTVALFLQQGLRDASKSATIYAFAYPIKEIAKESFGWDGEKDDRGRALLQDIGTEVGRRYNPDIWVSNAYGMTYDIADYVIMDDWRFPNEYEFLAKVTGKVFKIKVESSVRGMLKGNPLSNHLSETALDVYPLTYYDIIIDNSYSMESLQETCKILTNEIIKETKDELER
jgi:hypothetical protein